MKKLFFLFFALSVFYFATAFSACKKEVTSTYSTCIQEEIDKFKKLDTAGSIEEYTFNNKTVFVFGDDNTRIADGGANVLDENCKQICFLGGIAGFTTCEGIDFSKNATLVKVIWKR